MSIKLTPYYRTTQGQVQFLSLNAQGVLAGVNAGQQNSYGVELAFDKGNFAADGFAMQASLHVPQQHDQVWPATERPKRHRSLNNFIKQYNSFTSACVTPIPTFAAPLGASNAHPPTGRLAW